MNLQKDSETGRLSVWDAASIVVGTIIGAGVFQSGPRVASNAGSAGMTIALWIAGGILSLLGAVCFAEMASRFRNQVGGDWIYLRSVFGKRLAFLFAWTSFWVVRPGNIGLMSLIFAQYAIRMTEAEPTSITVALIATGVVTVMALINLTGLRAGAGVLKFLTLLKILGVLGVALFALAGTPAGSGEEANLAAASESNLLLGMVFVMFAFGGWNDVAFVTGEIRDPNRNVWRAIIGGTVVVTILYVTLNAGLLVALGFEAMRGTDAAAADAVARRLNGWGLNGQMAGRITSAIVCVSCLSAVNAMLITTPRIMFAALQDWPAVISRYPSLRGSWGIRVCLIGTAAVTSTLLAISALYENAFDALLAVTAPWFWSFLSLVPLSLIWLRIIDKRAGRSKPEVAVPLFPLPPVVTVLMCWTMSWSAASYVLSQQLWSAVGVIHLLIGIGVVMAIRMKKGE